MRIPVPTNRLVALTLVGALLTTVVAGGLLTGDLYGFEDEESGSTDSPGQVAADAPTPNDDFTPAVQTQSGYEDEHEGADDDDDEDDDEHEAEHDDRAA